MIRTITIAAAIGILLLVLSLIGWGHRSGAAEWAETTSPERLVITGSSTLAPLVSEIAKRYESEHPGVRIDVQTGGSSRGIADARSGAADLGMASRDLKAGELDLWQHAIALDGIGLIAHASNPVGSLSKKQVRGIYLGTITNWREVGGPDAEIVVVNKAEGRATLELFLAHFGLTNSDIEADVVIGANEQGVKTVVANPHAIGYVSIGTAEYNVAHGVAIKLLATDGVEPSLANVRNGTFPITRHLNLITRRGPGGLIREFIDYARSSEVSDLVDALYYVSLETP